MMALRVLTQAGTVQCLFPDLPEPLLEVGPAAVLQALWLVQG